MQTMILLSTPYTFKAKDESLEEKFKKNNIEGYRYQETLKMANHLMNSGIYVFSPIIYGFSLIQGGLELPPTWEYWQGFCEASVRACEFVFVLALDGWDTSTGVAGEIAEAKRQNKKVLLIKHDTEGPLQILQEL